MELDELLPEIPTPDWETLSDDSTVLCLSLDFGMTPLVGVFPVICPDRGAGAGPASACWPDQKPVCVVSA